MDYTGFRPGSNEPDGYSQYYSQHTGNNEGFYVPPTDFKDHVGSGSHVSSGQTNVNYHFIPNPAMTGMAMQYGTAMMGQGAEIVQKNVNSYLASSRVKYYFAVNNSYVAKKLGLLLFPFAHTKWSTHFDPSGPVPPGDDLNAPDLYIPLMAFITYVLVSGAIMGIQSRFSPEQLGILSSEALGWLVLEVLIFMLCIYLFSIQSHISYLDVVAFSGYKFVSMLVVLGAYMLLDQPGYYFSLVYVSMALAFFLIRTLKVKLLPHPDTYQPESNKRPVYLLLLIALVQPLLIWWLTRRMIIVTSTPTAPAL